MTGHDPLSICRQHEPHITYRRSRGCPACRLLKEISSREHRVEELSEVIKTLRNDIQNLSTENTALRGRVSGLEKRTMRVAPQILSLVSDLGVSPESTNGEFGDITNEIFSLAGDLVMSVEK
jgi:predicted nuclease with TOPRIM domain